MLLKTVDIQFFKGLEHVLISDCSQINALVGKNNSGKSSVLQAIDMAGLALTVGGWDHFQPKLEIRDLFWDAGNFNIDLTYSDNRRVKIFSHNRSSPQFSPGPTDDQKFKSIFIQPDSGFGLMSRRHRTPRDVMNHIDSRNFAGVNALDILYAIKFYSLRRERGLNPEDYENLVREVQNYFPDISAITSNRTENDLATLTYEEYGRTLDILYSGTGLKHFLDVLIKTTLSGAKVVLLDEPELGLHPDLQRQFMIYLHNLADQKNIQFFLSTHSQIILNHADTVKFYRITNIKGKREVFSVASDAVHTLLGDLGIRPSDIFNSDICLLVEGSTDVVYFEHIIRGLYKEEFDKISVAILQYGGSAAEGIISGAIDLRNIIPTQKYVLWTHDRDASPGTPPPTSVTQFRNKIEQAGLKCHVFNKREIEYYFPQEVLFAAQQGDPVKESNVCQVLNGAQDRKFSEAVAMGVCVPKGKYLRKLLKEYLINRNQLDQEIQNLVEILIAWKKEVMGEV